MTPEDSCRVVVVDGELIRVRGGRRMNPQEVDAFADVVRAAKRLLQERLDEDPGVLGVSQDGDHATLG